MNPPIINMLSVIRKCKAERNKLEIVSYTPYFNLRIIPFHLCPFNRIIKLTSNPGHIIIMQDIIPTVPEIKVPFNLKTTEKNNLGIPDNRAK